MATCHETVKCSLIFANTFIQSSIMIRREILLKHPYDKDFPVAEDYQLWCKLSEQYKLKNIPVHLTQYRWHGANISADKKGLMDSLIMRIYNQQLSRLGIIASEEDLTIHAAIRDRSLLNMPPSIYLNKLKQWMKKLADAANNNTEFDRSTLLATIAFRWIFACNEWNVKYQAWHIPVKLNAREWTILMKLLYQRLK